MSANVILFVRLRKRKKTYRFRWVDETHKRKERQFAVCDYDNDAKKAREECEAFQKFTTRQVIKHRAEKGETEESITRSLDEHGLIGTITYSAGNKFYEVQITDGKLKTWYRGFRLRNNTRREDRIQHRRALLYARYISDHPTRAPPISVVKWEREKEKIFTEEMRGKEIKL